MARILIGCEESQVVTKAFRDRGHEAYSCDLVETRGNPDWHIQGDIMDNLEGWDLIILHPDCTAMAVCSNRWYAKGKPDHQQRLDDVEWTLKLWKKAVALCDKVVLENPGSVIFPHLRRLGVKIQYIQPWMFGHKETKKTGLALHGVPELKETYNVEKYLDDMPEKEKHKVWYASPGENRKRDRSVTYSGIADAFADQWGHV